MTTATEEKLSLAILQIEFLFELSVQQESSKRQLIDPIILEKMQGVKNLLISRKDN